MKLRVLALFAAFAAALSSPVLAQSHAEFVAAFSGQWQVYDQQLATGSVPCKLDLSGKVTSGPMPATVSGCGDLLAGVRNWSIADGQLALYTDPQTVLVKLGGNQKRMTGATADGVPVIIERAGGDGTAATLQGAYNASRCYYVGYTQKCADKAELGKPLAAPDGRIHVQLAVNLNVRSEPRADAASIGTAKAGTCIVADACTMASDGPWCRAKFGTTTGWLRKFALRQNRWPIVAYANACTGS